MEETPLLSRDKKVADRGNIRNLLLNNLILCVMSSATHIYTPVMSQYIYHRVANSVFGNDTRIQNFTVLAPCFQNTSDEGYRLVEKAQEMTSTKMWQFTTMAAAIAVVSNVILGSYSDIVGRRFLFLLPMTGHLFRNTMTAVIIYWRLDLNYFYLVNGVDAMLGGESAFVLVCCAFAADNTPPEQIRTFHIVIIDCIMGLAQSGASTATGYFIQNTGFFYPSLTSALLTLVAMSIVIIFIKPPENNPERQKLVSPAQGLRNIAELFISKDSKIKRAIFWFGLGVFFFSNLANAGGAGLATLFFMNLPFCWSPEHMGNYITVSTVIRRTVGAGVVRLLQCCVTDEILGIIGSLSVTAAEMVFSFATTDWMIYTAYPGLGLIGFLPTPVIRGVLSKQVPSDRQGAIFACLAVVDAICQACGSITFNNVYAATVDVWRGAVFMGFASSHVLATILFGVILYLLRRDVRTRVIQISVQEEK